MTQFQIDKTLGPLGIPDRIWNSIKGTSLVFNSKEKADQLQITSTDFLLKDSNHFDAHCLNVLKILIEKATHEKGKTSLRQLLIRNSINRIKEISLDLFSRYRTLDTETSLSNLQQGSLYTNSLLVHNVALELSSIVAEKRLQYNSKLDIKIELNIHRKDLFALIDAAQFKRVISNLVNNSIEAIDNTGKVTVNLIDESNSLKVICYDTGKGIPIEILNRIGEKGITYGKKNGHGYGLSHAKSIIKAWNGNLEIRSEVNKGTSVQITLPKAKSPIWFLPELQLSTSSGVCILDDDLGIHRIWKNKLKQDCQFQIDQYYFTGQDLFSEWLKTQNTHDLLFFIDYDLNAKLTGLDVIQENQLQKNSVLVTGRASDPNIVKQCEVLGVKLLHKSQINEIPIKMQLQHKVHAVLIDDSSINRDSWELSARRVGLNILTFSSSIGLLKEISTIDKTVPLFFDHELEDGVLGVHESKKFYDLGFVNLSISSGYRPEYFGQVDHIKGITGKKFPLQLVMAVQNQAG